nr:MAG TPA: Receptor Binding Protein [Caudoviricetes sp.]
MADIITYPENGITYDADDASGFLSTRLSGVYSAEEDFAVTAQGGLSVQVSAGQAWVRPARFKGRSIIMEQPTTVVLTEADPVRSRIDRIVLRYDAAAKKTRLQVLDGTPDSAAPAAPDISRTELVYDLCLAEIRRPAGSTAVTTADITDTRADEAICGVMRDGVTGIPTAQLQMQAKAMLDSLQAEVDSRSFYTKAEADAEHAKLQEQLNNIGSLTSRQVYCQRVAESMTIPDDVDYVVLTNSDCTTIDDTCAVVARGGNAYATHDSKTDKIKFGADGTLTVTITSGYYFAMSNVLGFRYEVSAAFPCLIGSIVVDTSQWQDHTSGPVPDGTDFITFSANTVADAREIPINRGQSYAYKNGLSFKTDGTIVTKLVSDHSESFKVNCYKYMTPSEWNAHMTELQSAQSDADALAVDQDYRLTLLELGVTDTDDTENT